MTLLHDTHCTALDAGLSPTPGSYHQESGVDDTSSAKLCCLPRHRAGPTTRSVLADQKRGKRASFKHKENGETCTQRFCWRSTISSSLYIALQKA